MNEKRKVIVHNHVFKNAGTSDDHMLKDSLGERWVEWDTPNPGGKISPAELETFILDHPDIVAVSSDQAMPPLPDQHLDIYPIVFLRHPVDRAYSAYLFEWNKQQSTDAPIDSFEECGTEKCSNSRQKGDQSCQTLHLAI